ASSTARSSPTGRPPTCASSRSSSTGSPTSSPTLDDPRADQLLEQARAVRREEPAHGRLRLEVRGTLAPACEHRLARRELADAHRRDAPRMLPSELGVDLLVVLTVVAE